MAQKDGNTGQAAARPEKGGVGGRAIQVPADAPFSIKSLIWTVYAPSFLLALGQSILIPVLPLFAKDEMGASIAMVGVAVAARELGTMVFDVPAGLLTARFGTKNSMLIGVAIFAVSAVGAALSFNLGFLILMRVVSGLGIAMWTISRHAFIARNVPVRNRGRALSTFGGLGRIATILGPLLGGLLGQVFGLQAPFYLQAGVAIATLLFVLFTLEAAMPGGAGRSRPHAQLAQTIVEYRREFATAGLAAVALQLLRSSRQIIIPLWGKEIGLDVGQIGLVFSLSSALDAAMFIPAGYVMDRWGRRWTGGPSMVILAASLFLLPLTHSFWSLVAVGLVAGLGNGLSSGLVLTMGADIAPRDRAGEFLGVWRLITDSGGAAGPLVVGVIAKALALSTASLVTGGIGVVGAAVMIFLVQETTESQARHAPPKQT
ncbi:MAG: MFS transporter [Dehalococcoidia bacterium]|nr:MFS transporter [Dehalococcoidia bacterium]MSQ34606.1 MFS transporter [Dehalococcoidia bacterium]